MPEHTPAPSPARSLYGFFMYLFFKTLFFVYCAWAFIPDEHLNYFNIEYYPIKYWATAVPIECLVGLTLFAFIVYPSTNLMLVPSIDDVRTIQDKHTQYQADVKNNMNINKQVKCICKNENKCFKSYYDVPCEDTDVNRVNALHDLNISFVCKRIYLNKK